MNDYGSSSLIAIVVVSTFSFVALAGAIIIIIVRYQKRMIQNRLELQNVKTEYHKKLLQSSVNLQERERERIARDLHDEIGASLSAAKLILGLGLKQNEPNTEIAKKVNDILDHTIQNVKSISQGLLPVNLKKFGLSSAIKELCFETSLKDLQISFTERGDSYRLDLSTELGIFRITQELVSNALKHSGASSIEVVLEWLDDACHVEVTDNGKGLGMKTETNSSGLGLDNIHSRAQTINAVFAYQNPQNGTGTKGLLIVPVKQ